MTAVRPVFLVTVLAPVLLASCATRTFYRPRERVTAESPGGRPAAQYTLTADSGARLGTLRLWSGGADYDTATDGEPLVLDLSFEVENVSGQALVLDREALFVVGIEPGGGEERVLPRRAMTPFEAAPGGILRADFAFDLGVELDPGDLEAFSVRWTVRAADGTAFQEITPFRRQRYSYAYPYDPYWYGSFRWGYYWCR